jgi:hypothetical protein
MFRRGFHDSFKRIRTAGDSMYRSIILAIFLLAAAQAVAQVTTEFTYQGELEQSGTPADGNYDFRFTLWDAESNGTQLQGPVEDTGVPVNDGLFTAHIDFGSVVFGGQDVWLQIEVAEAGIRPFETLGRQQIKPAPMAQHALTLGANAVGSTQIVDGSITAADIDSGAFWSTSGDAAGSGDFLGTTNTTPLELRVNDTPVMRILDATDDFYPDHAPNVIIGSENNTLDESGEVVDGATILGGGGIAQFGFCGPDGNSTCVNTVSDDFATVVGGQSNFATNFAAVAMGYRSNASGPRSTAMGGGDASGANSVAIGGSTEAAGVNSMATGSGARALHDDTFVWADSTADFISTGPNQFLVRAAGGVGINTSSPLAPLTVSTENKWNPSIGNGYGDFHVGNGQQGLSIGVSTDGAGSGTVRLWPATGGNVQRVAFVQTSLGVGRSPDTYAFEVEGDASKSTAGDWLANSDRRIKRDVRPVEGAVDRLMRLRPITFRYASDYLARHEAIDDTRYYNVIAQEYAEVFPDAVDRSGEYLPGRPETPENEILNVDFHPATVTAVAAVQELAVRVESLESENARLRRALEERDAEIRAELEALREAIRATGGSSN